MKRELYINGRLMDLSDDTPIALSYQVNDIAELADRQADYSNRFTVPETNNNAFVLNFSDEVSSNTKAPYRKLPCTYIQNGIPIITNGVAIIEQANGNYDITIYSGIYDFFSQIGDKSLTDLDWSEFNHMYDTVTIHTLNDGYIFHGYNNCWPLVNWGGYSTTGDVDIKYQMPAISYPYIIQKIFASTTYSCSGQILSESIYKSMMLLLSPDVFVNSDDVNLSRSFKAYSTEVSFQNRNITQFHPVIDVLKLFQNFTPSGGFNSTDGRFHLGTSPISSWFAGGIRGAGSTGDLNPRDWSSYISNSFSTVDFHVHMWFYVPYAPAIATIFFVKNGIIQYQEDLEGGDTSPVLYDTDVSINLIPGDVVQIYINYNEIYINQSHLGDMSYVSATITDSLVINSEINYNKIIPALKLKDIIRGLAQKFALIITPSKTKQEIIFTEFREIKQNIAEVEDWSDKVDLSSPELLQYRIGNYTQVNNLKWADDDNTQGLGNASFLIDDQVLDLTSDLFQLIYSSSLPFPNIRTTSDQPSSGNEGLQIPRFTLVEADAWEAFKSYDTGDLVNRGGVIWRSLIDANSDITPDNSHLYAWEIIPIQYVQTLSAQPRLILVRQLGKVFADIFNLTDGSISTPISAIQMPLAYFGDLSQPYQLSFSYLIPTYYQDVVNMLNELKVLYCLIRLSEIDIANLDFLKLKYIRKYGNYFYLNKIDEYIEGQSTNCQLIRM